jgi:hypothetical protein
VVVIASAAPVAAGNLKRDLAWGSGTRSSQTQTAPLLVFNASSNPDGSDPIGNLNFTTLSSAFSGVVTCLNVKGSTAILVGRINTATGGFDGYQGQFFVQVVQDLGSATKRHPAPDLVSAIAWDSEAGWNGIGITLAGLCADPFGVGALPNAWGFMVSGDYTVIDR